MSIDYATAGRLLATLTTAWQTFDGDTFTSLFADRAEVSLDPFGAPMVGHNDLRAMLLENSREQDQVEITVERHWVSGTTVLASFHVSLIERATRADFASPASSRSSSRRTAGSSDFANGRCAGRRRPRARQERRPDGRRGFVRRGLGLRRARVA